MTGGPLDLVSTSLSEDAGYLASRDLAEVARELAVEYRLIGGISVTLLTWFHGVADDVPTRDTGDADFGTSMDVLSDSRLPAALADRGYVQVSGKRFRRTVVRRDDELELLIDLLGPTYSSRLESNVQAGELSVDAVPGFAWRSGCRRPLSTSGFA